MASDDTETTTDSALLDPNDLMYSIKGMYRILDLISEAGSGGLGTAEMSLPGHYPPNHREQRRRLSSTKDR